MSLISASAASMLLHALFVVLVAAMVSASVSTTAFDHRDDVNTTTTMLANGSSVTTTPTLTNGSGENWDMYYCFLCTERHPLLIHYCPIYWDECHLVCWDDMPSSTAAAIPEDTSSSSSSVQGKECYVMKLYKNGRYVIVERRTCDGIGSCFLSCGGGELPATTTIQAGGLVPFELCNTEFNKARALPSVPARRAR